MIIKKSPKIILNHRSMIKQNNKILRKNFEIKRCHFQMGSPALHDMMFLQHVTIGKRVMNEAVWVQEGYDNIATYFVREQLRALIDNTMEAILGSPNKIDAIHKKTVEYNEKFLQYAKSVLRLDLRKLTNNQLAVIWKKWVNLLIYSHGYALPTTWFVDSDGEDFSKFLIKKSEQIIKEQKSKLNASEVFSVLTTPLKPSFAFIEENESLKILQLIKTDAKARKIFLQNDVKKIKVDLHKIDARTRKKIISHYNKWRWVPYTYVGPAYEMEYYLEVWSGLLRQKLNITKELQQMQSKYKIVNNRIEEIVKELKIDKKTKHLFDIASGIIFLKSYRKDCWFHGCYVAESLYKEIGCRLGLSLNQVWFMGFWEVAPALEKGGFDSGILNERIKFSVLHQKGEKGIIYTGKKAKQFLSKLNIEKVKIKKVDSLEGTCACPGKIKGIVKIVNLPEEMGKMNKGDIMIAHTTFPSLVPAMKKASAIVTDDGVYCPLCLDNNIVCIKWVLELDF